MSEKNLYYKATDKDMKCRGYQFKLGKWSDPVEGDLVLCENGYHFCKHPSGVWAYYDEEGTRVFKCEVRDAVMSDEPGADVKSVCRQIRLVEEVEIGGDYNTGDRNTGDYNTGDYNVGNYHSGVFGVGDAPFTSFGVECDRDSFPWGLAGKLHEAIHNQPEGFDVKPYLSIPGATEDKIREYHKAYLEATKEK